MQAGKVWIGWVVAGALTILGYCCFPNDSTPQHVIYIVVGLLSSIATAVGARLNKPARPGLWYWFAAGLFIWMLGDVTFDYYAITGVAAPYPSLADVFYIAAYPVLAVGFVLLLRSHTRKDTAGLIDASLIATALGLVFWVFVLHPVAAGTGVSLIQRATSIAYPAGDVLLLAMLARLFTTNSKVTLSTGLLGMAAGALLIADVAYALVTLQNSEGWGLGPLWLGAYVLWAAASLHPSMVAATAEPTALPRSKVWPTRLAIVAGSSLLAPGMLFVPGIWHQTLDRIAVASGAVVLILLVVARLAGFMREVQRQSAELERFAMSDDLTGLGNRRRFDEALSGALVTARPYIALLGLNNFKNINDELGHPVGDRLLTVLAERLVAAAGQDALVARMSGDEFAVLLATDDAQDADEVARRLSGALHEPISAGGHELLISAGIGLAAPLPGEETDHVEIHRRAAVAMYAAKQTGEPYRCWTPAMDERAGEHARLGAEMRAALDAGQFRVVYQPIVEFPAGRVAAVEALVRWDHPDRGLISPGYFIPVAEQNGLIVELGEWILLTSCRRMAHWRETLGNEAPDRISVNASARQLARPGFADTVAAALAETGLPSHCLTIEVTETAVFEGGQAVTTLHELRALGVRIALDDFGTGHSSLGLLQTVPVDVLKVDKSFVDNITEAGRHAVIAEALIQVSRGLGLSAVAEGVETAEQAAALRQLGYKLLQGYHFGRPVADPDFALVRATASV